jgi:DNA-binding beta-propeller fold protein YncE
LALKPDGGEMFVSNFDGHSVSVIETGANEVGGTYLIGTNPVRATISADNSLLYVSNFGSDTVSVFAIDNSRLLMAIPVGNRPDAIALSPRENYILVVDTQSADVAVIQKRKPRGKDTNPYVMFLLIPVGLQPNQIAVKAFISQTPASTP